MDASGLAIRRAVFSDIEAILRLFHHGAAEAAPALPLTAVLPTGYADAFERIDREPNCALMVAEIDGQLVGTFQLAFLTYLMGAGRDDCQIESMHVDPKRRGHGVGTAMMQWAIDAAKKRGCRRIQLTTNKKRKDAHRFYERLGFEMSHEGAKLWLDSRES